MGLLKASTEGCCKSFVVCGCGAMMCIAVVALRSLGDRQVANGYTWAQIWKGRCYDLTCPDGGLGADQDAGLERVHIRFCGNGC